MHLNRELALRIEELEQQWKSGNAGVPPQQRARMRDDDLVQCAAR